MPRSGCGTLCGKSWRVIQLSEIVPMFFRGENDARWHVVCDDRSDIEGGAFVSECESYAWASGMFASEVETSNRVAPKFLCRACVMRAPYFRDLVDVCPSENELSAGAINKQPFACDERYNSPTRGQGNPFPTTSHHHEATRCQGPKGEANP